MIIWLRLYVTKRKFEKLHFVVVVVETQQLIVYWWKWISDGGISYKYDREVFWGATNYGGIEFQVDMKIIVVVKSLMRHCLPMKMSSSGDSDKHKYFEVTNIWLLEFEMDT